MATVIGRYTDSGLGAIIVVAMRSPPSSRNASAASSPATPPPTISTSNGSGEEFTEVTATPGRGEPVGGASRPPG
jgi:hypothetical protein